MDNILEQFFNEAEDEYNYLEEPITESSSKKIKEIIMTLNTLNFTSVSESSDTINGFLECIIFESSKPVQILLYLEEHPEIVLFSTMRESISGLRYLPLRTFAISHNNERFNFTNEKWCLNNKIRCDILGVPDTTIKLTVRYT